VSRRRIAAVVLAAFAGLILVGAGLFPQEPLRRLVESRLRASLGPGCRLDRLHIVPALLYAEGEGLVVAGPSFSLTAPRLRLSLSPGILLGRTPSFREIEIVDARLDVRPSKQPPAGAWSRPVVVGQLAVRNATVTYADAALGGDVSLRGVDLSGGIGSGTLDLAIAEGTWARREPLAVGPVRARLRVSPLLGIDVDSFEARTAGSRLSAKGSLGRVGAFAPNLAAEATIDLGEASRVTGLPAASGVVSVTGRLGGSLDAPKAEALVEGHSLIVSGWPIDGFHIRLIHGASQRDSTTGSLELKALGGQVRGDARLEGRSLDVDFRADGIDAARLAHQARPGLQAEGALAATATLHGDIDHPLEARATVESRVVAAATAVDVAAEATGSIRPADHSVDLRWTMTADGGPSGPATARPTLGPFAVTAAGTAGGAWPPRIEGTVDAQAALLTHTGTVPVPVRATFRAGGAGVQAVLDARPPGGTLHAEGEAQGAVLDRLAFRADAVDLAPFAAGLQGKLGATMSAAGPLDRLTGEGHVGVNGLAWGPLTLGTATLGLDAVEGRTRVRLALPSFNITGDGEVPVSSPRTAHGSVTLAETPLAPLAPLLPEGTPLDGTLSGRVEYEVPLAAPGLRARGEFTRFAATSGRWSAETAHPFRLSLDRGSLGVEGLDLRGSGYSLTLSGRAGAGASDPVALDAGLEADLASVPAPAGWTLAGRIGSQIALTGTRLDPRASGAVTARDVSAEGPSLPALTVTEARVDLRGDAIEVAPARPQLAGGSLTLSGHLPLAALLPRSADTRRPTPAASLHAEWEGIQAAAFLARVSEGGTSSVAGALSGKAEITGDLTSLHSLRGQATLAASDLTVEDLDLHVAPVDLRLEAGRLTTPGITAWTDQGSLEMGGSVDLAARSMDVTSDGRLELRALSPFVGTAALSGAADVSLALRGPFDAPRPEGSVWVRDGGVRLRDIPVPLTRLNGSLHIDGEMARLEETTAVVGGGDVRLSGRGRLRGRALSDVSVSISGHDMALRYPAGLRSRLDADLSLTGGTGGARLAGKVRVSRALYDLDVALQESVRSVIAPEPSPVLRAIGLNIDVDIAEPVLIRNNLASLDVTGKLSFGGDMETPAPSGRLDIRPGGLVYVQVHDFAVKSGSLVYDGNWNPAVSLRASRVIRDAESNEDRDVELGFNGPLESVQPTLKAPPLSDAQAFRLVVTGSSGGAGAAATAEAVAGGQAASLVGGQAASLVLGRISRSLGLDEVSLQPELLARETDPGTRFTFGKQLTRAASLIYSVGLNGPEQRFAQLAIRPRGSINLTLQRQDDGTVTYGAGQRLRFGEARRSEAPMQDESVRLAEVRLEGDRPLADEKLRGAVTARPGKNVTPWSVQEDADRLRERLVQEGFVEAEVGARLEGAAAVFRIRSGPRFAWRVSGMEAPPDLTDEVRKALFEEDAIDRGTARLLRELRQRGHLRARVSTRTLDEGGERILDFEATPGPRLEAEVRFPGAAALTETELLSAAGGAPGILTSTQDAARRIGAAYAARYFLAARVGKPQVKESGEQVTIVVPVTEGEPARIASLRFEGATRSTDELERVTGLAAGVPFSQAAVAAAVEDLRSDYLAHGYPGIRATAEVLRDRADAAVVLHVVEGRRAVVGSVAIVGLHHVRESLVRRRIDLGPGEPLDPRRLAAVERRLMEMDTFSRVVVTASDDDPATVTVEVEENARVVAHYDLRYSNESKTTAVGDAEVRNLLGIGMTLGGRYEVGKDIRDARGSLFLPSVIGRGSLIGSLFRLEEDLAAVDLLTGQPITNVRVQRGFQLQQTVPFPKRWSLLFGYRFKRVSSTTFPEPLTVAGLDTSLVQDTRDNPLDAKRGHFLGLNVSYSPKSLGSDFTFVKGFVQVAVNRTVGGAWTWAQGYRLGLAHGFGGQDVVSSERFYAGGANSLRGFATQSVGPVDFLGFASGGEAVVVLNQELRYDTPRGLGAAVFYDGGNVYATVHDMGLDLRHTLGVGLRWISPIGLVRFDLGFPLNRRPTTQDGDIVKSGDKAYQLFFSLGQAF
jgi:translocation and assembly module TamA